MISVVMPAHNEEGYLEPAVKSVLIAMADRGHDFEVIIVENGSLDGTLCEAERLRSQSGEVITLHRAEADYGQALRAGFLQARGSVVVNFDVDLVDFDFLDRAVGVLRRPEVSIVVGSKRGPGAEDRRDPFRRLVTAGFSAVLRHGFGLAISDTHGLKALRREPLASLVEQCHFGKDIFDTELVLRAERAGLVVEEVPVVVSDTRPPRTPIIRRIPRTLVGLGRLWWLLGPRRPGRQG